MLIIVSGLPGVGKTTIARSLARQIGAVFLRIDSIEQTLRGSVGDRPIDETGYRVGHAVAEDNLRLGLTVIADCVNPLGISRDAWIEVANRTGVTAFEIEVTCSDSDEHRRRVETRTPDISGLKLPTWQDVMSHHYEPWAAPRDRIVIDTATRSVDQNIEILRTAFSSHDG
jgi:predicted kinase